jgi:hypothetical protein
METASYQTERNIHSQSGNPSGLHDLINSFRLDPSATILEALIHHSSVASIKFGDYWNYPSPFEAGRTMLKTRIEIAGDDLCVELYDTGLGKWKVLGVWGLKAIKEVRLCNEKMLHFNPPTDCGCCNKDHVHTF